MGITIFGDGVTLGTIREQDLPHLWRLIYGEKEPEWKKWDAPYYPLEQKSFEEYRRAAMTEGEYAAIAKLGIWLEHNELIGTVGYYWEHRASNWLEIGISIYTPEYWSRGIGRQALQLWISHLFETLPLVRVGLTTWSGNGRMMRCAERLGMVQEARLRKCRLWQGRYYDSVRYGVLREEWEERMPS